MPLTVREHQSLIELPGPGYTPRAVRSAAGYFANGVQGFRDAGGRADRKAIHYAAPAGRRKIRTAAVSEAVQPISLLPGSRRAGADPHRRWWKARDWWDQAFEAAGFKNAFRVELMPEGADPMDIRYNMIQWVHRARADGRYGDAVTDPRTGEIIKGQVTLGSLRARQDYLIAEALLAPYEDGKPVPPADGCRWCWRGRGSWRRTKWGTRWGWRTTLRRARSHRATSVMDYPPPLIKLGADGVPDLSHAYAVGIGEWDKVAIDYRLSRISGGDGRSGGAE